MTASTVYLGYWEYTRSFYQDPTIFDQFLRGQGNAPQQYRIGVLKAAELLHHLPHVNFRHALTLIDLAAALGAVFLLLACLQGTIAYRQASLSGKAFACAAYVVLVQFYFGWAAWFQRPETFTTALSVALLLWLLAPSNRRLQTHEIALRVGATLAVAFLQALVRADVVVTLEAGILLLCLLNRADSIALPRTLQAMTSLLAVAIASGTQLYLMRVVYPHATYGDIKLVQIVLNLRNPIGFIPFGLFMTPYAYLLRQTLDRRLLLDRPSMMLIPGSLFFLMIWAIFGRTDEVRIMLPYTLALAPVLATIVMQKVVSGPESLPKAAA